METAKKKRQRKLLWILPLLAVPFITVIFWLMGGGSYGRAEQAIQKEGLNKKLPETTLPEERYTKLNYYDRAEQDSSKHEDLKKKDPFFGHYDRDQVTTDVQLPLGPDRLQKTTFRSDNEQQVMDRLKELQKVIQEPVNQKKTKMQVHYNPAIPPHSAEMEKLEAMMSSMPSSTTEDWEMQQINGMLENILDIQHPQRIEDRLKKEQRLREGEPLVVTAPSQDNIIGTLSTGTQPSAQQASGNSFYSLENSPINNATENAIAATIAESQVCVNGSTVKIKLLQEIVLKGISIPKNTFVYGIATLKGERLTVEVSSIRYQNSLYPVALSLYDIDGIEGIFIPGAITRDVAKASADRSMQGIGITTLEDSWGAQAAGAGVEAAKSLLSKKVKLVKVKLKSGYQVLLKDKKQQERN